MAIRSRSAFAATYLRTRDGDPWVVRDYQRDSLESWGPRKVVCAGRDVGKTSEIEITAAWAMVNRPHSEMLVATQCENHLHPLMHRIVRVFETTPKFAKSLVKVKRTPSWMLEFSNGFVLWGRIAGPRGINFQGLHVDWQLVDEAQEMTDSSWGELYQALNAGGRRWVYGVPNGLRNGFYRMTQDSAAEVHLWPSYLNRDYDHAKDDELARLYGGRNSPGYIHRVLGQHGMPEHAVFDLDDYAACVDDGIDFWQYSSGEASGFAVPESICAGDYYLGCDLGYARDPSEFVVYCADGPDLVNVGRVHLAGVNYARQIDLIRELDHAYDFRMIGIDSGNSGRAVAHQLMQQDVCWCEKVFAIEFGGSIVLDPLADGSTPRRPAKQFMTELLVQRMADRTIVFPQLDDRETQYASHTYALSEHGRVLYRKGDDHIVDADRCAVLARYEDTREAPIPTLMPQVATFGRV